MGRCICQEKELRGPIYREGGFIPLLAHVHTPSLPWPWVPEPARFFGWKLQEPCVTVGWVIRTVASNRRKPPSSFSWPIPLSLSSWNTRRMPLHACVVDRGLNGKLKTCLPWRHFTYKIYLRGRAAIQGVQRWYIFMRGEGEPGNEAEICPRLSAHWKLKLCKRTSITLLKRTYIAFSKRCTLRSSNGITYSSVEGDQVWDKGKGVGPVAIPWSTSSQCYLIVWAIDWSEIKL